MGITGRSGRIAATLFALGALVALACSNAPAGSEGTSARDATKGASMSGRTEFATLGGGCFWCMEAVFERVRGVTQVTSGFSGGTVPNPSYDDVCTGTTGHAEVVQVRFDPEQLPYRDLLEIFFTLHDPTTLNRQGNDAGTQYRSVIFYHSPEQKKAAEETIAQLEKDGTWNHIVTQVVPFEAFYSAEAYHQQYYDRNSSQGYCRVVISPKLAKLRQKFASRLKDDAKDSAR